MKSFEEMEREKKNGNLLALDVRSSKCNVATHSKHKS